MGGSGGFFSGSTTGDLRQQINQSIDSSQTAEYNAEVANYLRDLLSGINSRDVEAINRHLSEIHKAIEKYIDGSIDLRFGGSVAKHTYVDGLSDVDCLVFLDNSSLKDASPEQAKQYLADRLSERFTKTDISIGNLAVTLKFSDAEIQLVPAIRTEAKIKISSPDGVGWSHINPDSFARKLTEINQSNAMRVVPVVKLAKSIISGLSENQQISGYHAESIGIQAFQNYNGGTSTKEMLRHYFNSASSIVRSPIHDHTGQSVFVDESLGSPNSMGRLRISEAFTRIANTMNSADSRRSIDTWRKVFGE